VKRGRRPVNQRRVSHACRNRMKGNVFSARGQTSRSEYAEGKTGKENERALKYRGKRVSTTKLREGIDLLGRMKREGTAKNSRSRLRKSIKSKGGRVRSAQK